MPYDEPHFSSSFLGDDVPEPVVAQPNAVALPPPAKPPALFDAKRMVVIAVVTLLTILVLKYLFDKKKPAEEEG